MKSANIVVAVVCGIVFLGLFSVLVLQGALAGRSSEFASSSQVGQPAYDAGGARAPSQTIAYYPYPNRPTYHVFNFFDSGWISLMLVFALVVAMGMLVLIAMRSESILATLLYIIGSLLIFSSAVILLFGINDMLTYSGYGETYVQPTFFQQYGWLIESVLFGAVGHALIYAGDKVQSKEGKPLSHLAMIPGASFVCLATVPIFMAGVLSSFTSSGQPASSAFLIETFLFGIPCAALFLFIDSKAAANGEAEGWSRYALLAAGNMLMLGALGLFFLMVMYYPIMIGDNYRGYGSTSLSSVFWPFAAYLGAGSLLIAAADRLPGRMRKKADWTLTAAAAGFLLIFAAATILPFGLVAWEYTTGVTAANYSDSLAWVVQTGMFLLSGSILLYASQSQKRREGEPAEDLRDGALVAGLVLALALFILCISAIELLVSNVAPRYPPMAAEAYDLRPLADCIAFGVLAFLLVSYRDKGLSGSKGLASIEAGMAGLFLLAFLWVFVFDLNSVLYSGYPPFWAYLLKLFLYAAMAALLLFHANSQVPLMGSLSSAIASAQKRMDAPPDVRPKAASDAPGVAMARCRHCKSPVRVSDRYCFYCGKRLASARPAR